MGVGDLKMYLWGWVYGSKSWIQSPVMEKRRRRRKKKEKKLMCVFASSEFSMRNASLLKKRSSFELLQFQLRPSQVT
jgi:hypothetical protein